jgi:hypothetical protein
MTAIARMTLEEVEAELVCLALGGDALEAAHEWRRRQRKTSRPTGSWDRAGRYYPSAEESRACCVGIRTPSRNWPHSLWAHVHSIEHVAHLYRVERKDVMRALRMLDRRDALKSPATSANNSDLN